MSRTKKAKTKKTVKRVWQHSSGGENNATSLVGLAFIELGKDKVFQTLTDDNKLSLVNEVLEIGKENADWAANEYSTHDPRKIAVSMGLRVTGEEVGKLKGSVYRKDQKEIIVFRDYHDKLAKRIDHPQLSDNLLKLLVAHKLFQHIELERIGEVYKRYKFKVWQFGPFVKEKPIKALSNVAAHAFTLHLLGLDLTPKVFDYLTYIMFTN